MTVYHSPSVLDAEFIGFLEKILENLIAKTEYIVMGDFNIDFMVDLF